MAQNLIADSPLTSTDISEAYQDFRIVKIASKQEGLLTKRLMRFLTKNKKPIELKLAVINELGWSLDGKNNAELFYEYLKQKKNIEDIKDARADILICYAYLKALDNYHDVKDAMYYARRARAKEKNSYSINIICALIEAQNLSDSYSWCKRYKKTNEVRENKSLNKDMKDEAIKIIFDYMDLYKRYCK